MSRPWIEFIFAQKLGWQAGLYGGSREGVYSKILSIDEEAGDASVIIKYPPGWSQQSKKTILADISIHSDAQVFITELKKQLSGTSINISKWLSRCQNWKKKYPVVLSKYKKQTHLINSYYFIDILSNLLTSEDVIVTDMGIAFQGTHQAFKVKKGQKLFKSTKHVLST